jgi:hypothetical protein
VSKALALIAIATASLIAAAHDVAWSQPLSPPHSGDAAPEPYAPSMGDLMNTLIQPRHTKLWLAGHAGNWRLAAYALSEIRQSFAGIEKAQPKYRGMPVAELADAALGQPLNAVEAAIRAQDAQLFAAAYDRLTQGCNACHQSVDHPFVVIKTPDASAFPDQDFSPGR